MNKKHKKSNIPISGVEPWYNKRQVAKQCHINKHMAVENREIVEIGRIASAFVSAIDGRF